MLYIQICRLAERNVHNEIDRRLGLLLHELLHQTEWQADDQAVLGCSGRQSGFNDVSPLLFVFAILYLKAFKLVEH